MTENECETCQGKIERDRLLFGESECAKCETLRVRKAEQRAEAAKLKPHLPIRDNENAPD